jgi:hypothetical protein
MLDRLIQEERALGALRALRAGERAERSIDSAPWIRIVKEVPAPDALAIPMRSVGLPPIRLSAGEGASVLRLEASGQRRTWLEFREGRVAWASGGEAESLRRAELRSLSIELGPNAVEVWGTIRSHGGHREARLFAADVPAESVVDLADLKRALALQDFRVAVRLPQGPAKASGWRGLKEPEPQSDVILGPYWEAWEQLRDRERRVWVSFAGFVGSVVVGAFAGAIWSPLAAPFMLAAFVFGGTGFVTQFQTRFFSCPRCPRLFEGFFGSGFFTRRCAYCGLPKWATRPE